MAQQIRFFQKNIIDLENDDVTITITDSTATNKGDDFINFIRNRSNDSAWLTTDSNDAANTTLEVDWVTAQDLDTIILVKHNWKAFTIKYWNGAAWTDFSTAINETTNSAETSMFQFDSVETTKIQIIITGAQVADADKELYQLICTSKIATGQLEGWPVIRNSSFDTSKRVTKMLSGKIRVVESLGSFGFDLTVSQWNIQADLNIVENVFFRRQGFLVWLAANDEAQFSLELRGYRLEDLFVMRVTNDYSPDFYKGLYRSGVSMKLSLRESID